MKNLIIGQLLATLVVAISLTNAQTTFPCNANATLSPITESEGLLVIDKGFIFNSSTACSWTSNDRLILHIRALHLANDDRLSITNYENPDERKELPSSTTGIIALDKGKWTIAIEFGSSQQQDRYVDIFYTMQRQINLTTFSSLPINNFGKDIFNINVHHRTNVSSTLLKSAHPLSIDRAQGQPVNNYVLADSSDSEYVNITINSTEELIHAWDVLSSCSGYLKDPQNITFGLNASSTSPYACVQLIESSDIDQYLEIDFKDFKDVNDEGDILTLVPSDHKALIINKRVANLYENTKQNFEGNGLVILYESPLSTRPLNIPMNVIINAKFGGPMGEGPMKKLHKSAKEATFIYNGVPGPAIVLKDQSKLPASISMDIFDYSNPQKPIISFKENEALPPVITLGDGTTMGVRFRDSNDGKALMSLPSFEFRPRQNNFNKSSYESFDFLSVSDMNQSKATWLVGTKDQYNAYVVLSLNYLNFTNDKDCAFVTKLTFNSRKTEDVASFCGKQAYKLPINLLLDKKFKHYISLTKDDKTQSLSFYASYSYIMPRDQSNIIVPIENNNLTLTTIGYPSSYPFGYGNQTYILKTKKNVTLTTFQDVDIRGNDQLIVVYGSNNVDYISNENYTLVGDILTKGAPAITLKQLTKQLNSRAFTHNKGYSAKIQNFDYGVKLINGSTTTIPTLPINTTAKSAVVMITSRDIKQHKRILFNLTADAPSSTERVFYDSRTYGKHNMTVVKGGLTTSDTLIIVYRFKEGKSDTTLPPFKLDYQWKECDTKSGDILCDKETRCVPKNLQCNGIAECDDMSDELARCSGNSPIPNPQIREVGLGGLTVFMLIIMTMIVGIAIGKYGQDAYRYAEGRFRSGDYTAFASTE